MNELKYTQVYELINNLHYDAILTQMKVVIATMIEIDIEQFNKEEQEIIFKTVETIYLDIVIHEGVEKAAKVLCNALNKNEFKFDFKQKQIIFGKDRDTKDYVDIVLEYQKYIENLEEEEY